MYYTIESKRWLRSMGVWRKVSVKRKEKKQLALKLNRSLGEL